MGQNLKETLFLGNIKWYEMWKENIQGVFGFIWDKVVLLFIACKEFLIVKKVEYF